MGRILAPPLWTLTCILWSLGGTSVNQSPRSERPRPFLLSAYRHASAACNAFAAAQTRKPNDPEGSPG
eukprot:scaffold106882_cov28-Tisochrysis_lutea.AAC.3